MRKFTLTFALAVLAFAANSSQKRKVLIFGLDGIRSDALQLANTPNIDTLIATGVFTYDSWNMGITVSGPSWSTIFTGVWFPKHGVTDNSYAGSNYDQYPYFPTRAKQINPNLFAVQMVTWSPMSQQVYNDGYDKKLIRQNNLNDLLTTVQQEFDNPDLDVMIAYTNIVDGVGHSTGFSPSNSAYMQMIEDVDVWVGQVMASLEARPDYDNEEWLILLTTDHGGRGTSHGGNSDEERHIWWIASGKNVQQKQYFGTDPGSYTMSNNPVDPDKVTVVPVLADIAVTALHHLVYDAGIRPDDKSVPPGSNWNLDGKSWLDSIFVTSTPPPTSLKDAGQKLEITIYPNPTSDLVSIWVDGKGAPISWQVTNIEGKLIEQGTEDRGPKINIDLSAQDPGTYFINVRSGDRVGTRTIQLTR